MVVRLLHQIGDRKNGPNFNTLEEILACNEPLHFDGVYTSVWDNYRALKGKDITFFVSGAYVGRDNSFDIGQPLSHFCSFRQLEHMIEHLGAKVGWHGWLHRRCKGMSAIDIQEEIDPTARHTYTRDTMVLPTFAPILAWPYGDFDATAIEVAKRLGYTEAWSVTQGDGSQFQKRREHLNW